ncbi:hypothetical protein [Legionella micdadei]|uniref:hypothetical protein n=1 Tax=Legionella micdadei TaxID=451 RepID=UPI0009EF721C|nr:hypothetical protein [Legionella micdadei]ARH00317.1 hypothetical protein B6V88_07730 [Legionella micdadei]
MFLSVDNLSDGNCAFYAYSIALIDIIKHESKRNVTHTFETWCAYDPSIRPYLKQILSFNYKDQNVILLKTLQSSLRKIVHTSQLNLLQEEKKKDPLDYYIQQNAVYIKFRELVRAFLFRGSCDPDYNELADSHAVRNLAQNLAKNIYNHASKNQITHELIEKAITIAFLKDVYGESFRQSPNERRLNEEGSVILAGLKRITQDYYWGRFADLNILSETFDVNFHCLTDGEPNSNYVFRDKPGRPIITLNNEDNLHWTTQITTSFSIENSSTKNYHRFCTDSLLTKQEIQKIYKTYTTGFIAFFGRNHMAKGREIVQLCDDPHLTVDDIISVINHYINDSRIKFNSDSSFMKRANYLLQRYEYYNGYEDVLDESLQLI